MIRDLTHKDIPRLVDELNELDEFEIDLIGDKGDVINTNKYLGYSDVMSIGEIEDFGVLCTLIKS